MTKFLVNFTRKNVYLLWLQNSGYIYVLVLLFQLMLQENIVKVVLRYAVGSITVYTIWRLFATRYTDVQASFGILTLEGQPPSRHLSTELMGRLRDGDCPSRVKITVGQLL